MRSKNIWYKLTIEGPVGSGKSLLIQEFKKLLQEKGFICYASTQDNKPPSESMRFEKEVKP